MRVTRLRHDPRRPGVSLSELLIAITIITLLLSLSLPAIQLARESARRARCTSNLRQVGIALQSYHELFRTLPPGCVEWRGPASPPTNKQFAWSAFLLPQLDQSGTHARIDFDKPFDHPENAGAAAVRVGIYECPSASGKGGVRARTDYGGLFGQRIDTKQPDNGVFLYDTSIRFPQILDGLNHTLAVAEDHGGPDSEWINGRNVFVQAHGVNDSGAWVGDNEIRSQHPGGAMALYAGGNVSFLSDQLELDLLAALITRRGGESIENPP